MSGQALRAADAAKLRHSLRTPLNHIIGYTEMVIEDGNGHWSPGQLAHLQAVLSRAREILDRIQARLPPAGESIEPSSITELRQDMAPLAANIIGDLRLLSNGAGPVSGDIEKIRAAAQSLIAFSNGEEFPPEHVPAAAALESAPAALPTGRLLVVDDDESNRDMLSRRLEREGYLVATAGNGPEALDLIAGQPFDLVLLDIVMPGMDGFELLTEIRSDPRLNRLPVIVTSALDDMKNVIRCIEIGAEDFVPKPFDPVLLKARIGAALTRRRIEDEKAELSESFRLLLESTGEGIYGVDLQHHCTFVNAAAASMLGFRREDLLGKNLHALLHGVRPDGSPYPEEACPIDSVLKTGAPAKAAEECFLRSDGSRILVEFSAHPILRDNAVHGAVIVFSDISDRKRREERLLETAKLESVGVLAGGIAHDFNNLLTGILGHASLIAEYLPPGDQNQAFLAEVIRSAEKAAELTRQLLAFAGKGQFFLEPVDLSAVIADIRDLISASVPKNVRLTVRLGRGLPPVMADPLQIRQLILNLVINAGEAIGADRPGHVIVETGAGTAPESESDSGPAGGAIPGRNVWLAVRDDGPGMDEATRLRIFEPFFTTKFLGRGLGLPAVLGIVRSHKGALRVHSELGNGSRFEVYLPSGESVEPPAPAASGSRPAILIVDDEEVVRRAAQSALEWHGYEVLLAENGREAVEIVRRRGREIAAVLLDMTMPIMGGEEACRYLRALQPDLPILISSGYDEQEVTRRFVRHGIVGFVQKPYSAAVLGRKIKAALDARKAQPQRPEAPETHGKEHG